MVESPVNPVNPDRPFAALTGPNDTLFPEWPLYAMTTTDGPFGFQLVTIGTRTGRNPRIWSLPVHEATLDETRTEAHRRLKESIEND